MTFYLVKNHVRGKAFAIFAVVIIFFKNINYVATFVILLFQTKPITQNIV